MAFFSFLQHIAQGDKKPGGGVFGALNNAANRNRQQTISSYPTPLTKSQAPSISVPIRQLTPPRIQGTKPVQNQVVFPSGASIPFNATQLQGSRKIPAITQPHQSDRSIIQGNSQDNPQKPTQANYKNQAIPLKRGVPLTPIKRTNGVPIAPVPITASAFNVKNADTAAKVGKGIFHFLATADKAIVKTGENLVKGAAQYAARTPETAVRSGAQVTYDVLNKVTGNQAPKTDFSGGAPAGLKKSVYGDPAQTYQSRIKGNQEKGGVIGKAAVPLGVAGALLDITPLGGARKSISEQLAKAATSQEVKKILGKDTPDHIAQAIAQTKDSHVINNILEGGGSKIPPPPPIQGLTPPAPSISPTAQRIRGALKSAQEQRDLLTKEYSQERGKRLATAAAAGKNKEGLEGYYAELQQHKGEFSKPGYLGLSNDLPIEDQHQLFKDARDEIKANPELKGYDPLKVQTAVKKVIFGDERPPQPSEINILGKVFGEDFAAKVQDSVDAHMQGSTLGEKGFALWRGGLLTGARTLNKVIVSHQVHGAAEIAKDVPAVMVDKFASLISGQRSMSLTLRGGLKGAGEALANTPKYLKTGEGIGGGTDFHTTAVFGNSVPGKIANLYATGPGRLHGAVYNIAGRSAEVRQIYSEAQTAAKNQGLRGDEKKAFIEKFVTEPTPEALSAARDAGDRAAFRQKTLLSDVVSRLQNTDSPAWNLVAKVIAPFQRIPSAIGVTGLVDYTPAGTVKTIVKGIQAAKSEEGWTQAAQQQFSKGLGRSITGAGAMIPGMMLYNRGMLSLEYPKDKSEQKLWQEEGRQAWSVKVGGKWRSLGTLGPIGIVLGIGGGIGQGLKDGSNVAQAFGNGMFKGLLSLQEETYLSGVNAVVGAVQEGGNKVVSLEKQYAGSIIPTFVSNWAAATDSKQRQIDTPGQSVEARIPGLRDNLPAKRGAFGESISTGGGYNPTGLGTFLDPFYSSKAKSGPVTTEMRRLSDAGFPASPTSINKQENFNGVKVSLNRQQRDLLQAVIGYNENQAWKETIASPDYKSLSDDQKQSYLRSVDADISTQVRDLFAQQYHLGQYSPTYEQDKVKSRKR